MTGEERTGWDLTEEESRGIVERNLDRLYRRRTRFPISYLLILLYPWILFLTYFPISREPFVSFRFCLITTLIAAISAVFIVQWRKRYLKSVRRRLTDEGDPESLIPGDASRLGAILKYVPALFRWKFPSAKPFLAIHDQAVLGAENLDWYLARPVRLLRYPWVNWLYIWLVMGVHSLFMFNPEILSMEYPSVRTMNSGLAYFICLILFAFNGDLADVARGVRVEVYRDLVLDWYQRHPVDDEG